MNNTDDQMEQMLRSLTPRRPSPELHDRIDRAITDAAPGTPRQAFSFSRALLRAAAAVLVAFAGLALYRIASQDRGIPAPRTVSAPAPLQQPSYQPVRTARYLVGQDDGGVIRHGESGPVRELRCRTLERTDWRDPASGRRCTIWRPHEQTVVVGVDVI